MINIKLLPAACAAVVLSLTMAAPVHATSFASASFSDFNITLIPTKNGSTPSISFISGDSLNLSQSNSYEYRPTFTFDQAFTITPSTTTTNLPRTTTTSTIDPLGANGYLTSGNVSGSTSGYDKPYVSGSTFSAEIYFNPYFTFTLGANTAALITVHAKTSATTTLGAKYIKGTLSSESAESSVGLRANYQSNGLFSNQHSEISSFAGWDGTYNPLSNTYQNLTGLSASDEADLGLTITNASSKELTGIFYFYASAGGNSSLAPVPEPETYAMLLAGFGVMSAVIRRKRKQA